MADPPDRLPWVTGTAAIGCLLAGLSWPVAMRALPLKRAGRVLGLVVAAETVSLGVYSVISAFTPLIAPESPIPKLWWVGGELVSGVLVFVMMVELEVAQRSFVHLALCVVALIGASTFGMLRWMAELLAFGGHLGDGEPNPGAGFGFAATLLVCGGVLLVRWRLLGSKEELRLSQARET